jgi:hypothetical protein
MGFAEAMSDNVEDKGTGYAGLDPESVKVNQQSFLFQDVQSKDLDSPEFYFHACYKAIAAANQALEIINEASNQNNFKPQKGEALVARAYAHFMLVTFFAKAYDPATAGTDPGIPYVLTPEKEVFGKYERKTVQYVYDMIEFMAMHPSFTLLKKQPVLLQAGFIYLKEIMLKLSLMQALQLPEAMLPITFVPGIQRIPICRF